MLGLLTVLGLLAASLSLLGLLAVAALSTAVVSGLVALPASLVGVPTGVGLSPELLAGLLLLEVTGVRPLAAAALVDVSVPLVPIVVWNPAHEKSRARDPVQLATTAVWIKARPIWRGVGAARAALACD